MRASIVSAFLVVASATIPFMGCGSSDSGSGGGSGSGSTGSSSNPCDPANQASCTIAKQVKSDCLALADYSGADVTTLRMAELVIQAPDALVGGVVQNTVVDGAVTLNLPTCNFGDDSAASTYGDFNWLLQFDLKNKKLKTGGAVPVPDPLGGYTFGTGKFAPVDLDITIDSSGKFAVAKGLDLNVPIYQDKSASTYIILPLHDARIVGGTLSADHNCIGTLDVKNLLPNNNCKLPEPYNVAGSLDGYITLEEADMVTITALSTTLCAVIAAEPTNARCSRDAQGNIKFQGDYCSTMNGCHDAVRLEGNFAAAAVKVN